MIPGEVIAAPGEIELNAGRERRTLVVENTGDRPVQVGSHFHFADVNAALAFDRAVAIGFRLDVPAGTGVRFEPGVSREVTLVALAGARVVPGLQIRPAAGSAGSGAAGSAGSGAAGSAGSGAAGSAGSAAAGSAGSGA